MTTIAFGRNIMLALAVFHTAAAQAADRTWDGGGANDNWNTAANWSTDVAPVGGDSLFFAGSTRLTPNNNFTAGTTFTSIYFNSGAGSFTLGGNQITVANIVENNSASTQTLSMPIVIATGATVALRTILGSGDVTISGVISGTGNLEKQVQAGNASTVILSGENVYSGRTTITAGNLSIQSIKNIGSSSASSLGKPSSGNTTIAMGTAGQLIYTGTGDSTDRQLDLQGNPVRIVQNGSGLLKFTADFLTTVSGAKRLYLEGSGVGEIAGNIPNPPTSGNTRLSKDGTGTWVLSGTNAYAQVTEIYNGTLVVGANAPSGSPGALGNATSLISLFGTNDSALLIGGPFTIGRDVTLQSGGSANSTLGGTSAHSSVFSGTVDLQRNAILTAASGGTVTFRGAITNSGSITKSGAGTVVMGGTNTYSGSTTISAGTLVITNGGSINTASSISIAAGATFDVASFSTYTWGSSASLTASGTGTTPGTSAATINGASGGTVYLGSRPVNLTFTPTSFAGDATHPSLYISSGTLSITGNAFTVNNAAGTALSAGAYRLIQQASGSITATGSFTVSVTGSGLAVTSASASITVSGGNVDLVIGKVTPVVSNWPAASSIAYGQALSASELSGGTGSVVGTFAFASPATTPPVGTAGHLVIFTPADSTNYNPLTNSVNVTVNQKSITASVTLSNKVYDGTTAATAISGRSLTGVVGGEDVNLGSSGSVAAFSSRNTGSYSIVVSSLSLSGTDAANYTLASSSVTSSASITPRPITVTASAATKNYDGTANSAGTPTITSGSIASGDTAPTWTQTYNNKHAGSGKTLTPAGAVVDGNGGGNYAITFVNDTTGVINPHAITITAASSSKPYDGNTSSATAPTITLGTVQSGDSANFIQTYDNPDVGTGKTLTPSGTVSDGNSGNNYSYTYVPANVGTITISASKLVFTTTPVLVETNATSILITIQRQDATGNPVTSESSRTVSLTSDTSGTATFTPASLVISNGSSTASFTYRDTVAGWPAITATSSSPTSISSATQRVTVYGGIGTPTWDGGGTNNGWSVTNNWTSDSGPGPGSVLHFAGSTRTTPSNDYFAGVGFSSIYIDGGASSFTLVGNPVSLRSIIENNSSATQEIATPVMLASNVLLSIRTILGSGNLTISGVISGEGGVDKQVYAGGASTLILNGSNTYSGITMISAGNLSVSSIRMIGSSTPGNLGQPTAANSSIHFGRDTEGVRPNLIYTGPGESTDRGIAIVGSGDPQLTQNGTGHLRFMGPITINYDSVHTFHLGGTGTGEITGVISNAPSFTTRINKSGTGTWWLSGTNLFTGFTTIDEGELVIHEVGTLGASNYPGSITLNGRLTYATQRSQTFSGVISSTGTLNVTGSGVLILSANNTFTGPVLLSGGILAVNGNLPANVRISNGGTLGGTGTVGSVRLSGGTINPGTSPGTLNVGSLALTSGTYRVEITNATGTAGIHWDLINVASGSGVVTNDATSGNPVVVNLSCTLSSLPGFHGTNAVSWRIIDAGSHVGFASNKFSISTGNFIPAQKNDGYFTISESSGDVYVNFVPVPKPADLGVAISINPVFLQYGSTSIVTIAIINNSAFSSGSYSVSNNLTTNLLYSVAYSTTNQFTLVVTHHTSDGGQFSGGFYTNGSYVGGYVSWTMGNLGANASTSLVVIGAQLTDTGTTVRVTNSVVATVNSVQSDPDTGNNTSSSTFITVGIPLLTTLGFLLIGLAVVYAMWRKQRRAAFADF